MIKQFFILLFTVCSYLLMGRTIPVNTAETIATAIKTAQPGDTILLESGVYTDIEIKFYATGTVEKPIVLMAMESGKVIFNGTSRLNLGGKHLIASGLWFKDGNTKGDPVIRFRKSKEENAFYCRVTECAITNYNPLDRSEQYQWVEMWGKHNRVDHCSFSGKTNQGPTLMVGLKQNDENIDNNHHIDHNHFGFRPPLGGNGGETIRIGTSKMSLQTSKTLVENNLFERCNGEIEIISNKSCDNIYRNNLFIENEGILTLRHGHRCIVEGNIFYGNNTPKTGGVRVINEGHIVQNNIFVGLKGDGFRSPLVVMNGVPNSPLNRYNQVKDVFIQNNTFINCSSVALCEGSDDERSLTPKNTVFANNLFYSDIITSLLSIKDDISGITFSGNKVQGPLSYDTPGFESVSVEWQNLNTYPIPTKNATEALTTANTTKPVRLDATGVPKKKPYIGAVIPGNARVPSALSMSPGVSWGKPLTEAKKEREKIEFVLVKVENKPGAIEKAVKNSKGNTRLELAEGTYLVNKTMYVPARIEVVGKGKSKTFIKVNPEMEKVPSYFFQVDGGGYLMLQGLSLDGEASESMKYGIISSKEATGKAYTLKLNDVEIKNFNQETGAIIKTYAGTFADTVSLVNCFLSNSERGLNFSDEKGEEGKYSAELITIENTVFKDIKQFAVNYFRGGNDESTNGGELHIDHCVFYGVANNAGDRALKTNGIKNVNITNTIFMESFNSKQSVALKGAFNKITHCALYSAGPLKTSDGAIKAEIIERNPKLDTETFQLKDSSPLIGAGNDGSNIGLKN